MAGGIFTPLLALGVLIGSALGQAGQRWLTGIVLIFEMTGDYNQMLQPLVACFTSYALAERLGDLPIYERLLKRDLLRGGIRHPSKEAVVIELEVEPDSPFDGKQIRDLCLPPGCIIVNLGDGKHAWVPTAATRLEAHTRLTAAIAPEAANAFELLHRGCEANGHAQR